MTKYRIGFIGLGMMGKYMALNLLKHGYKVVGYNRSKQVLGELKTSSLHVAKTPCEVAAESDIVVLMLPSSKETREVIFGKNGLALGMRRGQTFIDMSTSNPAETIKIMQALKKKGVMMLDAPVSRGQRGAISGTLSIMVGGEKAVFKKCLPVFKAKGKYIVHLGPFGSGQYVKALNNFLLATNIVASTEGLRMLKKNNVDLEKAVEVISESSGNNGALSVSIRRRLKNKHPKMGFFLRYMAKDIHIYKNIVDDMELPSTLVRSVSAFYDAMARKYPDQDLLYVFEHYMKGGKK